MYYLKSFWSSLKEKPIIIFIFVVTMIFSVIISCTFYRITKSQAQGIDPYNSSYFEMEEAVDSASIYDEVQKTNIVSIQETFEKDVEYDNNGIKGKSNMRYYRSYFPDKNGFSREELDSRTPIAIITTDYSENFNIEVGDVINFGGVEHKVIRKKDSGIMSITVNGSINTRNDPDVYLHLFKAQSKGAINGELKDAMKSAGAIFSREKVFELSAIVPLIMGIVVMAIAAVNVFFAFAYIMKRNARQNAIFKIVGAKNSAVALSMIIEMSVYFIVSYFIGILIENPIARPLTIEYFATLNAVDYVAIFMINAIMIVLTLGVRIFKQSKAVPADKRLLSK